MGWCQLRCRRRRLDQLLELLLLLVHAVDPAEGDWVVVVLDGPPAAGDGVVIVPLVRLDQATLAVYILKKTNLTLDFFMLRAPQGWGMAREFVTSG